MKNFFDILIIGGGASGIMAAISAAQSAPVSVALLEKNNRTGKKLLATGNGRCNFTNADISLSRYHGENVKFAMSAFGKMSPEETLGFFEKLGIVPREEENGKIFPFSGQASSVLDLLRLKLETLGVKEIVDFEAEDISEKEGLFELVSFGGKKIKGRKVIVCTGGKAGPQFGTDGSGYVLLEKFGHTKTAILPAIDKLKSSSPHAKALKGIKTTGNATLFVSGKKTRVEQGEILFTDYGLSGPPILQLSGQAAEAIYEGNSVEVTLDILPEFSEEELAYLLKERRDTNGHYPLEQFMAGLVNKQIGKELIKAAECGKLSMPVSALSDKHLKKLSTLLKDWRFEITGSMGFKDAQTTAGGIKTSEFVPQTMESRLKKGLYAAGEILDIYGDCGGFNLQWAWSSGYLAGLSATKELM